MRLPELHTPHTPRDPDWRTFAACRDVDPELFFLPGDGHTLTAAALKQIREAAAVCAGCPVFDRCEQWADRNDITHGVWAGQLRERRRPRDGQRTLQLCGQCQTMFAPRRAGQRYCCRDCQYASLRGRPPAGPCGSPGGARRHRLRGEPVDPLCRLAETLALPERTRQ
jgi:WhiB family redox-sensing transcriptional regulator